MNVGQAAHLSRQMSGQTAQMNQVPGTDVGVGVGVGGADGLPQHQPMQEMAALSGTDHQFVMLWTAMREKIFEYIGCKQSSAEWRKRLPELAKRLEEILYRKFPNKNDYYNMTKGPVEPQLQFAIKTLSAQNQQNQRNPQVERQTPPSSSSNLVLVKVKNPLHVSEGQIHKKLRCHFCKKIGHLKKDCLKRKKWFEKKGIHYVSICLKSNSTG
ncbi:probable histone acetyltransferase HAC-like 1 [Miscanthus floridulus]|uniref:probable histone acetyltransferase HAC-like 1 n=1 Tax=Miscanthus floridulus TaxID=154761 RepID=UPI0034586A59